VVQQLNNRAQNLSRERRPVLTAGASTAIHSAAVHAHWNKVASSFGHGHFLFGIHVAATDIAIGVITGWYGVGGYGEWSGYE
jgi:hypothetical protein